MMIHPQHQTFEEMPARFSADLSDRSVQLSRVHDDLRTMFERVVAEFDASRASLMVKHATHDSFVITAHKGLAAGVAGAYVSVKESLAGWVALKGRPLHISETGVPEEVQGYLRSPELASSVIVPVLVGDAVVGVLNLARYGGKPTYTQADLQQLLTRTEAWDMRPFKMNTTASLHEQAMQPAQAGSHAAAAGRRRLLQRRLNIGLCVTSGVLIAMLLGYFLLTLNGLHYVQENIPSFHLPRMPEWGALIGYLMVGLITVIGIRFLSYYRSFFFHWRRYRQLEPVTTDDIRALPHIPFVKVQITTRGTPGSTEVIQRGIRNIARLCDEAPDVYGPKLSVEVITESHEQQQLLAREFRNGLQGDVFVLPKAYKTPNGTQMKYLLNNPG